MYLKRLELIGFKSFFDKTIIDLRRGMTAIVGPNGCGKSNLIDAVLWVLGEQRPKALRGEKMEDVIFNGTENRKPLGMAEVSLTLGDISEPTSSPYSPYSEITITRRLFRSGESEYEINQVACRLKDIRELLIDFKAGYKIHTIIEQGRVDEILASSPAQRRELVEEAANVTRYRLRKEEALRKLDATERNLVRIQDISAEVKRQINALDRLARQAQKYQQIYETLKSHELTIAGVEWNQWTRTGENLIHEEQSLRDASIQNEAHDGSCRLKIAAERLSLAEKEQAISQQKDQMAEVDGKIGRAEGRIDRTRAQKKEWAETEERTKAELLEITQTEATAVLNQSRVEQERQIIDLSLPEIETRLLSHEEQVQQISASVARKLESEERERTALSECASRLTEARNNLVHFDARKETLARKRELDIIRANEVEQRRELTKERLEKFQEEWAETERTIVSARASLNQAQVDLKNNAKLQEEDKTILYKVQESWARKLAELASKEGFYRGLFGSARVTTLDLGATDTAKSDSVFIADVIDVPNGYEKAIEAALGERLRGMVIETISGLKKGIKQLQELKSGRGIFILREPPSNQQQGKTTVSPAILGVIGTALDLVSPRAGYEEVVQRLLDGVLIVRDIDAVFQWMAEPLSSAHPSFFAKLFVSLQGEVIDPSGIVSAGEVSGLFEQKRIIAALSFETETLHAEVIQLELRVEQNKSLQREIQFQAEQLEGTVREIESRRQALQKEIHALTLENDKIQLTHQTILFEQEGENEEGSSLLIKREKELLVIGEIERQKDEKSRVFAVSLQEKEAILSEKKGVEEKSVLLRLDLASLREKQKQALESMDQIARSFESLKHRRENRTQLIASLTEKAILAHKEESESLLEIEAGAILRGNILEGIRTIVEDRTFTLAILEGLEGESKKLSLEKNKIVSALNDISVRRLESQMTLEKIREAVLTQYQIEMPITSPSPAIAEAAKEPLPIEEMRQKRDQLRTSLTAMGPVSLGAIEEYQELSTRYEFLKAQEEDLVKSTEDLKTAISKINKTTEGLFIETFHALNQKFGETFISFFGGGKAELILVDEKNPLESDIDIIAAPPGKKAKALSLLSGGEKALTALSLLFATFLNQPAPFCVLDEVDAPLDDENTRRFALAIERLSEGTQFMVITHNKRTMEKADILYGVTAEEAGVSKLISVSLKELDVKEVAPAEA
jgi:chromosome segregation protein